MLPDRPTRTSRLDVRCSITLRSRHSCHSNHTAGFSLIELIITIGIIALLIALVSPMLAMARSTAQQVQCATYTRQLGIAIHSYAMENNDYGPNTVFIPGRLGLVLEPWAIPSPTINALFDHGFKQEQAICPSAQNQDGDWYGHDPEEKSKIGQTFFNIDYAITMGMADDYSGNGREGVGVYESLTETAKPAFFRFAINQPEYVMVSDVTAINATEREAANNHGMDGNVSFQGNPANFFNNDFLPLIEGNNRTHFDGSTKWITADEMGINDTKPTYGNDGARARQKATVEYYYW